jgi:hypothetical protein
MSFNAFEPTPLVKSMWVSKDNQTRLGDVKKVLEGTKFFDFFSPTRTFDDGQIYFTFNEQVPSSLRGILLLDLEVLLKDKIDSGVFVLCEPIGDKNSLRNLRGIEIIT